jgi:FkbM family methyltransferase
MTERRVATFKGAEYRYLVYTPDEICSVPGVGRLKGIADHPEGAAHATWGTFIDEAEVRERHWHLGPNDVVLDCGPAFGSYTLTAALQGARVYALEPSLFCRSILTANIAQNPDIAARIDVRPVGVHEKPRWFDPDNCLSYDEESDAPPGTQLLYVTSIDAIVADAEIGRVDMIKFDVEGAELAALKGAEKTIRTYRPRLLIEEHEFKAAGIGAECEALLKSWGYAAPERHNHGSVDHAHYVP